MAEPVHATLELAALLTALALAVANHRRRWHQRWLEYRLVEELWRKRQHWRGSAGRLQH
jgi:hypothetical protein